jgi:hypothetical protein
VAGWTPVAVAAAAPRPPAAPQAPAVPTGFVGRSGPRLVVDGHQWTFLGYNLPCNQPFQLASDQQAYFLNSVATTSGANAIRVWMFQSNGGPGNWGPFDQLIANAKAAGLRVVATLANEWNTCESPSATGSQKTLTWYQGGYKEAGDGYPLSFRDYATQVAAHYASEPGIAFWQLVNEAAAPGSAGCDEVAASSALRSFTDDMSSALHAVDHNHLVNLGTLGGDQCGTAGTDYAYVHSGSVDLCEYHDYGDPWNTLDQDQSDGLATRLNQCDALPGGGKPLFVGESGLVANIQPAPAPEPTPCGTWPTCAPAPTSGSLALRASVFQAKINAALKAGIAGYEVWFKSSYYSARNDPMAIGSGDPTEAMMAGIKLPAPPASVPESQIAILLPISAAVLLAGAGGVAWRRRRVRTP